MDKGTEVVMFIVSGSIGTALFYLFYEALYYCVWWESYKPAFCWLFSYLISILWQMELHARLVFRRVITNYWSTLLKTYATYGISIVLSTVINSLLVDQIGINHRIAWWITIATTGAINYFTVSNIMKKE